MSHTPGPWIYLPDPKCRIVTAYPNPIEVDYNKEDPQPISIISTYGAMGGDDTTADATLMAAAPELLQALENTIVGLQAMGLGGHPITQQAERAIAKARGEQP